MLPLVCLVVYRVPPEPSLVVYVSVHASEMSPTLRAIVDVCHGEMKVAKPETNPETELPTKTPSSKFYTVDSTQPTLAQLTSHPYFSAEASEYYDISKVMNGYEDQFAK